MHENSKLGLSLAVLWAVAYAQIGITEKSAFGGPVEVGAAKQVFIDGRFLGERHGVELVVNRPRITGEKLLVQDKPWEDDWIGGYTSVIQEGNRIRMWYETADRRGVGGVAYAYSLDGGRNWTKPNLGVVDYQGSTNNNLVVTGIHGSTVFKNRPDAPPDQKYGMFVINRALVSPDGIHWKPHGEDPFLDPTVNDNLTLDSQNVIFWDTRLKRYVAYARFNFPQPPDWAPSHFLRKYGRAESKTFGDFGEFDFVLEPDVKDPKDFDHYTTAVIEYPFAAHAYYMFPAAYHHYPSSN